MASGSAGKVHSTRDVCSWLVFTASVVIVSWTCFRHYETSLIVQRFGQHHLDLWLSCLSVRPSFFSLPVSFLYVFLLSTSFFGDLSPRGQPYANGFRSSCPQWERRITRCIRESTSKHSKHSGHVQVFGLPMHCNFRRSRPKLN